MSEATLAEVLEALCSNAIQTCDLSHRRFEAQDIEALSTALQNNTSVTELSLAGNCLEAQGMQSVARALRRSTALARLDVHGNALGLVGTAALMTALADNASLKELIVDCNNLGDKGAVLVAEALREKAHLTAVSVAANNIGDSGGQHLLDALRSNTTLISLDVADNPLTPAMRQQLNDLVERNVSENGADSHAKRSTTADIAAQVIAEGGSVDAVVEALDRHHGEVVAGYKRTLQGLTALLHAAAAAQLASAPGSKKESRATSPLPLECAAMSCWPHDVRSIWDPAAITGWEPLAAPEAQGQQTLPLNFSLCNDDTWSRPTHTPTALDWDPLSLFTPDPTKAPAVSIASPFDSRVPAAPEEPSAGAPAPQTYLEALARQPETSPRTGNAAQAPETGITSPAQVEAEGSEDQEESLDMCRPKEPTRISNLRRRLQRIQITKQKLEEGVDPPPDHRQVAAISAEAEIAEEIALYERTGNWNRAPLPEAPAQMPKVKKGFRPMGKFIPPPDVPRQLLALAQRSIWNSY